MEKTFETPKGVRLFVQNEVGLVAITAGPASETVVRLEPGTPRAEELIARAIVECRPSGGRHVVVVKIPKDSMRFVRRNAVTVRIELPEGSDVAATASADVEVTGPIGVRRLQDRERRRVDRRRGADFKAKSASGDFTVGDVGGDLRVQTASGDLRCSSIAGRAAFTTASGDLEVGAAANQVEVKATSGDVRLGELGRGARVTNVSGDVRVLALDEGHLHVRSVSGDVSVGVARGVDLHVDVETMSATSVRASRCGDRPGLGAATCGSI